MLTYSIVQDIGSGLNCRKPGLKKLLALLVSGSVRALVLTYQDRLLRFGRELVFPLCSLLGIKVTVLDDAAPKSPAASFADAVLAIIAVFSANLYGARSPPKASSHPQLNFAHPYPRLLHAPGNAELQLGPSLKREPPGSRPTKKAGPRVDRPFPFLKNSGSQL